MLGDNPEKSRNPLKKAMRRRNAKTVTFTDPTYYEPSDHEYSSEEDENDEPEFLTVADVAREDDTTEQAQNDSAVVEPLKVRSQKDNQAAAENVAGNGAQQNEIPDDVQTRARSSSDISDPAGMLLLNFLNQPILMECRRNGYKDRPQDAKHRLFL